MRPPAGWKVAAALSVAAEPEADALPVAKPVCGPLAASLEEAVSVTLALGPAAADDEGMLKRNVSKFWRYKCVLEYAYVLAALHHEVSFCSAPIALGSPGQLL